MNKNFIVYSSVTGEIVAIGHCPAEDVVHQNREPTKQKILIMHDLIGVQNSTHRVRLPAPDHCGCTSGCGANCGSIEQLLTIGE